MSAVGTTYCWSIGERAVSAGRVVSRGRSQDGRGEQSTERERENKRFKVASAFLCQARFILTSIFFFIIPDEQNYCLQSLIVSQIIHFSIQSCNTKEVKRRCIFLSSLRQKILGSFFFSFLFLVTPVISASLHLPRLSVGLLLTLLFVDEMYFIKQVIKKKNINRFGTSYTITVLF